MRKKFDKNNLVYNESLYNQIIANNPWMNDINFNNVDIIECRSYSLYLAIKFLIENKVIKCNILIDQNKTRYYYDGKQYYNKGIYAYLNNTIHDYLRDSEGNLLFFSDDKYGTWCDKKYEYKQYDYSYQFDIEENKEDLITTYNK